MLRACQLHHRVLSPPHLKYYEGVRTVFALCLPPPLSPPPPSLPPPPPLSPRTSVMHHCFLMASFDVGHQTKPPGVLCIFCRQKINTLQCFASFFFVGAIFFFQEYVVDTYSIEPLHRVASLCVFFFSAFGTCLPYCIRLACLALFTRLPRLLHLLCVGRLTTTPGALPIFP